MESPKDLKKAVTVPSGPLSMGEIKPAADQKRTMKAIVQDKYGSPDFLELREIHKPWSRTTRC